MTPQQLVSYSPSEAGRRANSADVSDKTLRAWAWSCWQEKGKVQLREAAQGAGFGLKAAVLESKPVLGAASAALVSLSPLLTALSSGTCFPN